MKEQFPAAQLAAVMRQNTMRTTPEIPKPNYDEPKEIFAFFGLAYYQAAVLEHGVLNLAVALLAKEIGGISSEDVDRLFDSFDMKTFGQVIKSARDLFSFPEELEADLLKSLQYRNYLAHRFFVDHAVDLVNTDGERKMIDELIDILKHLQSVDIRMDELWMSAWESLGITKEWIEEEVQRYISNH